MRWAAPLVLVFVFFVPAAALALPTSKVVIDTKHGPVTFEVQIAGDEASQERGLMYVKHLAPNAGMLFDFHTEVMTSFWMKNTYIPLDMLFIQQSGIVSSIAANARPMDQTTIPSLVPVRAVLEIDGGRAKQLGIQPGDVVHNAIFGNAK